MSDPRCKRTTLRGNQCGGVDAHVFDCPALAECPWARCLGRFSKRPCAQCVQRNADIALGRREAEGSER